MSEADAVYAALAAEFPPEVHKTLERAGGQTYVPWNLVAERLNTVLGVEHWSFRVIREGFTATECWVLGEISATIRDTVTVRQQYGVAPIVQGQRETPVDDLLKKAGTDALKKCAQVFGVALYLTDAEAREGVKAEMRAIKSGQRPKAKQEPAPEPTCDVAFFTRKWHATVKGSHLEDENTRHAFLEWYSGGHFTSLPEWLEGATKDEAEALIATAQQRIEAKRQQAQKAAS